MDDGDVRIEEPGPDPGDGPIGFRVRVVGIAQFLLLHFAAMFAGREVSQQESDDWLVVKDLPGEGSLVVRYPSEAVARLAYLKATRQPNDYQGVALIKGRLLEQHGNEPVVDWLPSGRIA